MDTSILNTLNQEHSENFEYWMPAQFLSIHTTKSFVTEATGYLNY